MVMLGRIPRIMSGEDSNDYVEDDPYDNSTVCCQNAGSEKSLTRRQRHEEILAGQLDSFGDFL